MLSGKAMDHQSQSDREPPHRGAPDVHTGAGSENLTGKQARSSQMDLKAARARFLKDLECYVNSHRDEPAAAWPRKAVGLLAAAQAAECLHALLYHAAAPSNGTRDTNHSLDSNIGDEAAIIVQR